MVLILKYRPFTRLVRWCYELRLLNCTWKFIGHNKCNDSSISPGLFYRPVQPQSPQPPQYVFWQKNERMINYDDSRRDITIETSPGPRTQSRLIIREPQIADSGNYTCSASNTEPASIYVFVSKGNECQLIFPAEILLHCQSCNAVAAVLCSSLAGHPATQPAH